MLLIYYLLYYIRCRAIVNTPFSVVAVVVVYDLARPVKSLTKSCFAYRLQYTVGWSDRKAMWQDPTGFWRVRMNWILTMLFRRSAVRPMRRNTSCFVFRLTRQIHGHGVIVSYTSTHDLTLQLTWPNNPVGPTRSHHCVYSGRLYTSVLPFT